MSVIKQFFKDAGNRTIILAVYIIGLFVHGSRFFTVYMAHDDLNLRGAGSTYTSGRWLLQVMYDLEQKIMGSHINAKAFIAVLCFALLAIICIIVAKALCIQDQKKLILLSAVFVTFPFVTSLFGYSFTADYYYIAEIMCMLAALLVRQKMEKPRDLWKVAAAVALLGLSMAIYQATLCMYLAFLVILAIDQSLKVENETWGGFILRCIQYLAVTGLGSLFYFVSNKLVLHMIGKQMTDYQGLNEMGHFTLKQMFDRVIVAYREFFTPITDQGYSLYTTPAILWCYRITLLALVIFFVSILAKFIKKKQYSKVVQLILLLLVTPAAINSIFLTADIATTRIYTLMTFQEIMVFVGLLYAANYVRVNYSTTEDQFGQKALKGFHFIAVGLLLYTAVYFGYMANVCYTKAAIQQEQTIGYFNRLIERIQSMDGYDCSMPVAYLNDMQKNEEGMVLYDLDWVYPFPPYGTSSHLNQYNWQYYMRIWCGYAPTVVSEEEKNRLASLPEVQAMGCYPNASSIAIVEGTIVVKFA